jgi:fatty-acyl-CoA synthase
MIIRGGENIYPREIEEIFHEHAGVSQVQVFGVPDERLGEEVAVWMMLKQDYKGTSEEIIEWLKSRIAFFKVPRHVRVVDQFPMTVTGKIQKFAMRDAMIKDLGLTAASQIQTA